MPIISLRVSNEESKLIHEYTEINNLSLSKFVRDAILEKIEDDFNLDEQRLLNALNKAKNEKKYDHDEAWKILGV